MGDVDLELGGWEELGGCEVSGVLLMGLIDEERWLKKTG